MATYPSSIISVTPPGAGDGQTVLIPKNEVFRVRSIFTEHEYNIPSHYLPSAELTVVDIGANVGLFALYIKSIRPDSHIYCFEPVAQTLALLRRNIETHERISVFPWALSNYTGVEKMYLHTANTGENSLKRGAGHTGCTADVQVVEAQGAFRQIGLNYVDILKIDTEGSEVEILESLGPYLPYVGIVMAEYHSEKDRRRIDAELRKHVLFDAKIFEGQRGVVKYIHSFLL